MQCDSRDTCAQNLIMNGHCVSFILSGGLLCSFVCWLVLFLFLTSASAVEVTEFSFPQTRDRAGLTNVAVAMINLF